MLWVPSLSHRFTPPSGIRGPWHDPDRRPDGPPSEHSPETVPDGFLRDTARVVRVVYTQPGVRGRDGAGLIRRSCRRRSHNGGAMIRAASILGWSFVLLISSALTLHLLGLIWIALAARP